MYSRSYYQTREELPIPPDNYQGTALREETNDIESDANCEEATESDARQTKNEEKKGGGAFSFLQKGVSMPAFISKLGIKSISLPGIGTEEILIIAAAAYLFFSSSGDKECAILLLLLLLVN